MVFRRGGITRRTFMATGVLAGLGGGAWVGTSSSWSARFVRERFAEFGRDLPPAPHKPAPASWVDNAVTLAWLGHADGPDQLLRRAHPHRSDVVPAHRRRPRSRHASGPLRLVQCALTPDELPEIDLVLVSHAHFDHLDTPSLGAMRGKPAAVMACGTSDLLPRRRYSSVTELRWNESATVTTPRGEVLVRAIEVKHWGARIQRDT